MASGSKKPRKKAGGRKQPEKQRRYESLHDLLVLKARALYDVEEHVVKALPNMIKNATSPELKEALEKHLRETETHVTRLEEVFKLLNLPTKRTKSDAIAGIIKDAEWTMKNVIDPASRDAAIIASAQYVEHYEIAGYGAAHEWADLMGHSEISHLLQATLSEEEAADQKLTELAESGINREANHDDLETGTKESNSDSLTEKMLSGAFSNRGDR